MRGLIREQWQTLGHILSALHTTLRRGLARPATPGLAAPFRGRPVLREGTGAATCHACERCVEGCPTQCLSKARRGNEVALALDWRRCIYCGICARVCPADVITLEPSTVIRHEEQRQ